MSPYTTKVFHPADSPMAEAHNLSPLGSSQLEAVRCPPPQTRVRRTQSLSATKLRPNRLPPLRSGTSAPSHPSSIGLADYIEQSRLALESQRLGFERERSAFAEERKLWEKERTIMKQRIVELERRVSEATNTLQQQARKPRSQSTPVWEGSSTNRRPTRVFPEENGFLRFGVNSRGRVDQESKPSLDKELSPSLQSLNRTAPISIPVEFVDRTLDGITLKSTGLPPEVVARISPQNNSTNASPSGRASNRTENLNGACQSSQPTGGTHGPAGNGDIAVHSPTAVILGPDEVDVSPGSDVLNDEFQLAPQPTLEQVKESDSHLPQIDEDPELQGPLSLQNDQSLDQEFLQKLDEKLKQEAQRPRTESLPSVAEIFSDDDQESDPEPIKFKNATNFGTAFGTLRSKNR
ncbi:hypothetical protein VTO42DRAFT_5621 [Malbranchea cinnamomea]